MERQNVPPRRYKGKWSRSAVSCSARCACSTTASSPCWFIPHTAPRGHNRPGATVCTKYVEPKTNAGFWKEKIARNIARDELNAQRLDTLAWTVITVWECELGKNTDATIARIEADLRAAKEKYDKWTALRRESREYAREQARKHREILAQVEAELNLPKSLRRYATREGEILY